MSIRDDLRQRINATFQPLKTPATQPPNGESCVLHTLGDATRNFSGNRATKHATTTQQIPAKPREIRLSSATGYATAMQQMSCTPLNILAPDATSKGEKLHVSFTRRCNTQSGSTEAFEERAAIMEFDGGLNRADAERLALLGIQRQELEALICVIGPANKIPDHEYSVLLATARGDLANALIYYREQAKQIEALQ